MAITKEVFRSCITVLSQINPKYGGHSVFPPKTDYFRLFVPAIKAALNRGAENTDCIKVLADFNIISRISSKNFLARLARYAHIKADDSFKTNVQPIQPKIANANPITDNSIKSIEQPKAAVAGERNFFLKEILYILTVVAIIILIFQLIKTQDNQQLIPKENISEPLIVPAIPSNSLAIPSKTSTNIVSEPKDTDVAVVEVVNDTSLEPSSTKDNSSGSHQQEPDNIRGVFYSKGLEMARQYEAKYPGELEKILTCSYPGWQTYKVDNSITYCLPKPTKQGLFSYKLMEFNK